MKTPVDDVGMRKSPFSGSWKTSATGWGAALVIIGTVLKQLTDGDPATNPDWNTLIPAFLVAIGLSTARDNNVSSEDAGLKG